MMTVIIILLVIILLILVDIERKINILHTKMQKSSRKQIKEFLQDYIDKKVIIVLNNDNVLNSELFEKDNNTAGIIRKYNDSWFLFEYEESGKIKNQYFRISNLESIKEVH